MQDVVNYPELNPDTHVLGILCRRGHDYKHTGMSMRNIKSNTCVVCDRMRARRYLKTDKGKASKKRAWQTDYTRVYQKKYKNTEKGKEIAKRSRLKYLRTDKGKLSKRKSEFNRRQIMDEVDAVSFTPSQLKQRYGLFNDECAYCGVSSELTIDHVKPVSKGGSHTIGNIVPCCKSCNSSKINFDFVTWYTRKPFFDHIRMKKILRLCNIKEKGKQTAIDEWF